VMAHSPRSGIRPHRIPPTGRLTVSHTAPALETDPLGVSTRGIKTRDDPLSSLTLWSPG
jgi:hypothetical protein